MLETRASPWPDASQVVDITPITRRNEPVHPSSVEGEPRGRLLELELERLAADPAARASVVAGLETWVREIRAVVAK